MPLLSREATSAYAASSIWTDSMLNGLLRFVYSAPSCKTETGFGCDGFVMSITCVEFINGDVTNAYVTSSTCKACNIMGIQIILAHLTLYLTQLVPNQNYSAIDGIVGTSAIQIQGNTYAVTISALHPKS